MAFAALGQSLYDAIIPDNDDLFSLLGSEADIDRILALTTAKDQTQLLYYPVSKLGNAAGYIASTLALHFGNSGIAIEIASDAFSKSVAGYIGDAITFDQININLSAEIVGNRFVGELARNISGFAGNVLAGALNRTFDIDSPLGQFVSVSLSSTVTNTLIDQALDNFYSESRLNADTAKAIFGLGGTDLSFQYQVISGEFVGNFLNGLGGFASSQVFSFLDEQWESVNLNNIGASLGGVIGGYFAPGIGLFIGQVAGGFIFDLLDGDPRSFHQVRWDDSSQRFVSEFVFSDDGGKSEISRDLSESALGVIQLATSIIGGEIVSIKAVEYGYVESDIIYNSGSGRTRFNNAGEMLNAGVMSQLRSLNVIGGNIYAKDLLSRANYSPTLTQLTSDLGVADIYEIHASDPFLFGSQIVNITDAEARKVVLTGWQDTLARSRALGFHSLPSSNGSEFLVRVGGTLSISGGRGNDFIYAESGRGSILGDDGDDIVRFDGVYGNGDIDIISGGTGNDRYIGSFSDYIRPTATASNIGMDFTGQYIYFGDSWEATITNFEQFDMTGTRYDDKMLFDRRTVRFDGADGIDWVNVLLSDATTDIIFNLGRVSNQIVYGSSELQNVERVVNFLSGSGNDQISVGTALLGDGQLNIISGGTGNDRYVGNFGDYIRPAASTSNVGIEFTGQYIYFNNIWEATITNFEQFDMTGTRYDDKTLFDSRSIRFDGGDGIDRVNVLLSDATTDIVFDLSRVDRQIVYGLAELQNVERVVDVISGPGNDRIIVGTALLGDSQLNFINGGTGNDRYIGNFSDYIRPVASTSNVGIEFTGQYIYSNNVWEATISNVEEFDFTGTRYDDKMLFDSRTIRFDGGDGIDQVDIQLSDATTDIVFDLGRVNMQIMHGSSELQNVERVVNFLSGSGNDQISVGTALLGDGQLNIITGGTGNDRYIGNFSDYIRPAASTSNVGIEFTGQYVYFNNIWEATITNFEQFDMTGTQYNDFIATAAENDSLKGGDGNDTLNGGAGNDSIEGGSGNDLLVGGDGADLIEGGSGDDRIEGGNGTDVANYSDAASNYSITRLANGTVIVEDLRGTSGTGIDTLIGIETLRFATVSIPVVDIVASLTVASTNAGQTEGNSGSKAFTFSVTRTGNLTGASSANWAVTGSGSNAADATDFAGAVLPFGNVSFAAGETAKVITVNVSGDNAFEPDDGFTVTLSAPSVSTMIATAAASGMIRNDDSDVVTGTTGSDSLLGTPRDESLFGLDGDDFLRGNAGNDLIDGGGGLDFAIFSQTLAQSTITRQAPTALIISGPDGNDRLTGIELLQFADGVVQLDDGLPLVDDLFYAQRYSDVLRAGVDPDLHYASSGWREGRDPNAFFSTVGYLSANSDVRGAGINPLVHFSLYGWQEGRDPSTQFDTRMYLVRNPDVAAARIDPFRHFLEYGQFEGRIASPAIGSAIAADGFDRQFYLMTNADVAAAGIDPHQHFRDYGWREGRNPNAWFDTTAYLNTYSDVAGAGINPLDHFHLYGWREGRDPSVRFDTSTYLDVYRDVAAAGIDPLAHFLQNGAYELRSSFADAVIG
jgi:Ca2+-binding RTX toxin-like protein